MDDKTGMPLEEQNSPDPPSNAQSMQALYNSQQHAAPEAYRTSTPASNAPQLPPLQHFHGQRMQSQPHFAALPMNGAQMQQHPPHPPYNPTQFHYHNGAMQPPTMPSNVGANGMMRFPIPPQAVPGSIVGARPKAQKDIKRRTKTGCLTCRKRRIKCDEGHPICRNCQKSKRECLGYDPIFKQQSGPAPIQPAPATPLAKSIPLVGLPAYPPPQTFPGTGGTFVPATHPPDTVVGAFEYGASLDPALAGGDQSLSMASNSYSTTLQSTRRVKPCTMDQLFSLDDVPPNYQLGEAPSPNSKAIPHEAHEFYRLHYATGLDKFFETTWYTTRASAHLQQDPSLLDFVMQCEEQFKSPDANSAAAVRSLEARLIWQLATMPRSASPTTAANGAIDDPLTLEVRPRINTVEHLLTAQYLPQVQMAPPPLQPHQTSQTKFNEQNFWYQLGRFCSIRDDGSEHSAQHDINDALANMRGNLGMLENRDVLYSLAICRHFGGRMTEFHPQQQLLASNNPDDEVSKLEVARRFVQDEDQRGTTQVVQRICGMGMRSWSLQKQ